jgi:hypothetical protein
VFEIYLITNQITGKIYVGQTRMILRRRFGYHKQGAKKGSGMYLHKSMNLYGVDRFSICHLANGGSTVEESDEAERR